MSVLSKPYMHDEAAAFAHVESIIWPDGPVCPHCGVVDRAYRLTGVRSKPSKKNPEGVERHGLWKCRECRKQFTVRKGTIFEDSHIPMHKWLQAIHLMVSSKKGISAHQLHRVLEITHKSAWFMAHRIREAMRSDGALDFGANGGTVEVDETFIGNDRTVKPKGEKKGRGYAHKHKVLTLVDRNTGRARSMVVDDLNRVLKKSFWKDVVPAAMIGRRLAAVVGSGCAVRPSRQAKSFGNLARLQAAMVIVNCARTRSSPR
jgi:transposase-like protein